MFAYKKIFGISVLSLASLPVFSAENCEPLPDCVNIGFKYSASDCGSLDKMKCPFDDIHYFCSVNSACPSGYTSSDSACASGQYFNTSTAIGAGLKVCYQCQNISCPTGYIKTKPTVFAHHYQYIDTVYASDGQTQCYKLADNCNDDDYYQNMSSRVRYSYAKCSGTSPKCRSSANCSGNGSYNDACISIYKLELARINMTSQTNSTNLTCAQLSAECNNVVLKLNAEINAYNSTCGKNISTYDGYCDSTIASGSATFCAVR